MDQSARQRFIDLKWAFNAKPDFLIRGGSGALLVEAKVESGLGTYSGGSGGQLTTQKLIKELMVNLIPDFYELDIQNCTFGARSENTKAAEVFRDYSWKELVNCLEESELDDFTIKSLSRLGN